MSNFTPLVAQQFTFGDETINVKFSRFKRKDVLKLMPVIQRMKVDDDSDDDSDEVKEARSEAMNDLITESFAVLPDYIKEFDGLTDADGNALGIETVIDEMYFISLATEIVMAIMNESVVMLGGDAKNG
jgi:hypothetical protein